MKSYSNEAASPQQLNSIEDRLVAFEEKLDQQDKAISVLVYTCCALSVVVIAAIIAGLIQHL